LIVTYLKRQSGRRAIQNSQESLRALAKRYRINQETVAVGVNGLLTHLALPPKWEGANSPEN
jgi:hypothetical protein